LETTYNGPAGRRLAVSSIGDGPAIVFLHGFAGSRHEFSGLQQALAAAGYRALAIDACGFGDSDAPDDGFGLVRQTDAYRELFRTLGIKQALIVAHSMGGKYALVLAQRAPQSVSGLVLLAPDGFVESPQHIRVGGLRPIGYLTLWLARRRWMLRRLLSAAYAEPARMVTPERIARAAAALGTAQRRRALVEMSVRYRDSDLTLSGLRGSLREVQQPITLIWGRQDRVFPPAVAQRVQRELPHAQLHLLDNCGHFAHEEQPQQVFALIAAAAAAQRAESRLVQ
jgi:pimeloyl-ACP methyl ester carboxylesterase